MQTILSLPTSDVQGSWAPAKIADCASPHSAQAHTFAPWQATAVTGTSAPGVSYPVPNMKWQPAPYPGQQQLQHPQLEQQQQLTIPQSPSASLSHDESSDSADGDAVNMLLSIAAASSSSDGGFSPPPIDNGTSRRVTGIDDTDRATPVLATPVSSKVSKPRASKGRRGTVSGTGSRVQPDKPRKSQLLKRGRPRTTGARIKAKVRTPCNTCGKVFFENGQLHRHMKEVHMQLKQFPCSYCNKAFARRFNQRAHERLVHLKLTDHRCSHCSKGFGDKASVAKHERTVHLKQKDFVCDQCSRAFGGKGDLHRHQRLVHGMDTSAYARHTTLRNAEAAEKKATPTRRRRPTSTPHLGGEQVDDVTDPVRARPASTPRL